MEERRAVILTKGPGNEKSLDVFSSLFYRLSNCYLYNCNTASSYGQPQYTSNVSNECDPEI